MRLRLIILFVFYSIAIQPVSSMNDSITAKLKTTPDSLKSKFLLDISKEYVDINLDSAIYFGHEALKYANSNNENENIIHANITLSKRYSSNGDFNKSLQYLDQAYELSLNLKDSLIISEIFSTYGQLYSSKSEYDKAKKYFDKSISISKKIKDKKFIARSLTGIGAVYWERGDLERAIQKFIEAYEIIEEFKDPELEISVLIFMGIVYSNEGQTEKALEVFFKVLEIAEREDHLSTISVIYNNIAVVYLREKKIKKALEYLEKCLELKKDLGDQKGVALALNNIGETYLELNDLDKAKTNLLEAIAINRKLNFETEIIYNLNSLAQVYLAYGRPQKAAEYIEEGLYLCNKHKIKSVQQDFLKLQSEYYYSVANYKQAYKSFEKFNNLKDSLSNVSKSDKIAQLQTQFEAEKKEKENEMLRVTNLYTQEKLTQEKKIKNYLFVFAIFAILSFGLIFILFKSKVSANKRINSVNDELEESNQKLEETNQKLEVMNATKDKFFSIIAHDLRSPFNSILGFSKLITTEISTSKDLEIIKEYNDSVNESADNLFSLLENLLQWAKCQQDKIEYSPVKFDLQDVIHSNINLFKLKTKDKSINLISDTKLETYVNADVNMVDTILRNLISNAIKFTNLNGEITITSEQKNGFFNISIKDTGIGISSENQEKLFSLNKNYTTTGTNNETGSGLGLLLCKEFVIKNGGDIWVDSEPNKGSKFTFSLKSA